MKFVAFDRFAVIGHTGPFRPDGKTATTVRHAASADAPVRPSWWERNRLFEVHDLHALHRAVVEGHVKAIKRELAHPRSDPGFVPVGGKPLLFEALGTTSVVCDGGRMFHQVTAARHDVLQALLDDHRVDPDQRLPATGLSALEHAVTCDDGPAVAALLAAGAEVPPTLLADATRAASSEAAAALFRGSQADVHATLPDGRNALSIAAAAGNVALLDTFLAEGTAARVNERDGRGMTALAAAARAGMAAAARRLMRAGADADVECADGRTALWHAVARGREYTVIAMVQASQSPRDTARAAMAHAVDCGNLRCIEALLMHRGTDWTLPAQDVAAQYARAGATGKFAAARKLHASWVTAMRASPEELVAELRAGDSTARGQLLRAVATQGDLNKMAGLLQCADLQKDIATTVELLAAHAQWRAAARLGEVVDSDTWTPSPELLRKVFRADDHTWAVQRSDLRALAGHAGSAMLAALRADLGRAGEWQGEPRARATLPARLAAIVVAAMTEQGLHGEIAAVVSSLFSLDKLGPAQRTQVARAALQALERCNGTGPEKYYDSTSGDYQFKLSAKGEEVYGQGASATLVLQLAQLARPTA